MPTRPQSRIGPITAGTVHIPVHAGRPWEPQCASPVAAAIIGRCLPAR
jgi:hypothetical protein